MAGFWIWLMVELMGFHDEVDVGTEARKESNMSPEILVWATQIMELLFIKLGQIYRLKVLLGSGREGVWWKYHTVSTPARLILSCLDYVSAMGEIFKSRYEEGWEVGVQFRSMALEPTNMFVSLAGGLLLWIAHRSWDTEAAADLGQLILSGLHLFAS